MTVSDGSLKLLKGTIQDTPLGPGQWAVDVIHFLTATHLPELRIALDPERRPVRKYHFPLQGDNLCRPRRRQATGKRMRLGANCNAW